MTFSQYYFRCFACVFCLLNFNVPHVFAGQSDSVPVAKNADEGQATQRREVSLAGWKVLVDERLYEDSHAGLRERCLPFLENKLRDIQSIVPAKPLNRMQSVTIVLDLSCGELKSMQYHPSAEWLTNNGYSSALEKCVHIPVASQLPTSRNINEQPWVILHELSHAYHDQILGFDEPRIKKAYLRYKESGRGTATLLFNGKKVSHYALTNQMEFFAEMTEAFFGSNDFYPFNRAELQDSEPEIYQLLDSVWNANDDKS